MSSQRGLAVATWVQLILVLVQMFVRPMTPETVVVPPPAVNVTVEYPSDGEIEAQLQELLQRAGIASPGAVVAAPKTGRNESCYCGSGQKFKHCHGSAAGRQEPKN